MARIIVAGNSIIVESGYTLEDLKKIERYSPSSLELRNEISGAGIFKVGTTNGNGTIGTYGASFGCESRTGSGKALITMEIPQSVPNNEAAIQQYIEETVGVALLRLNSVERGLDDVLRGIEIKRSEILHSIETV